MSPTASRTYRASLAVSTTAETRSEERRVGKEWRSRWPPHLQLERSERHGDAPGAASSRSTRCFFSSRRRHTRSLRDWSSDVCSSDLALIPIRKSAAWWALAHDERRKIFEERSHHVAHSLPYLPRIARRLHHGRDQIGRASCRERVAVSVAAASATRKVGAPRRRAGCSQQPIHSMFFFKQKTAYEIST